MPSFTDVTFGEVTFQVRNRTAVQVPGTKKHVLGKSVEESRPAALNVSDWNITLIGVIDTTLGDIDTVRDALQDLHDGNPYDYTDGKLSGIQMIIPNNGLTFNDTESQAGTHYVFTLRLLQWQQN